jgi:Ca-activated chloride channel family protein
MVDTSASTGQPETGDGTVPRFLHALFREGTLRMPPRCTASITTGAANRLHPERLRLEKELKGLRSESGTSLYDALYFGARALESRTGRRVIVVISDGADTTSSKTFQEALKAVHAVDAAIYAVMVVPVVNDPGRHLAGENALIALAASTGGRVFAATLGDMLDSAFASILRVLRTQYLLGYYPRKVPYTKESFHRIAVKLHRPDCG